MKIRDVKKLPLAAYIVEWKSGGTSVATIGVTPSGGRWLAPTNWVSPSSDVNVWRMVKSMKLMNMDT
jgi:hypothetical protein